jgi:hypothetical protein
MSGCAIYNKVQTGLYAGFTKAEMQIEFGRYKTALKSTGSRLIGSSVNGQSFQFGPRADLSLSEWSRQIRSALSQVDPDFLAPSSQVEVRFA